MANESLLSRLQTTFRERPLGRQQTKHRGNTAEQSVDSGAIIDRPERLTIMERINGMLG